MGALSQGCGTCKKRKVKCDETHPKCNRCDKAGIECTGFVPRIRFVDEKPRIRRSIAVSHAQSQEFSTITNSQLAVLSNQTNPAQSFVPAPALATTLPLTAFKDDIFMSYLVSRFFEGESPCGLPREWTVELIETPQTPRPKSWDALAATVFGQAYHSNGVITQARGLYGQALRELYSQISDPNNRYAISTMASITALYIYEILMSKTMKGWMSHAEGLGRILQWKGPWQQKSYAGKGIFLEHRITLVAKAIMSSQGTFLRSTIWKTVPWEDAPESKSAMDFLIDIGADIAEYLAQIKTCSTGNTLSELEYTLLRTQVATSLEELNMWWHKWEAEHPQGATEVSYQVNNDLPFSTLLEYDFLWTAFQVCIYDVMRILLLRLWHVLQLFPYSISRFTQDAVLDEPNQTALLGITSNAKGLACEILRSLKYCYGISRRFTITSGFFFIQEIACGCFDQGSKEVQWVAAHGWAQLVSFNDVKESNLLKILLLSDKIRLEALVGAKIRSAQYLTPSNTES